jgi:hypothetical protein
VNYVLKNGLVGRAGRRPAGDARIRKDDVKFAEIFGECREEPLASSQMFTTDERFVSVVDLEAGSCLVIAQEIGTMLGSHQTVRPHLQPER